MRVEFIDKMGNDDAVCDAARVSFAKEAENFKPEDNTKLIKYLAKHNHWSPFSHAHLKFRISAPIFVARQLQKHVVGLSWNEVSRRYVDDAPSFYGPVTWRGRPTNGAKQGSSDTIVDALPHSTFGSQSPQRAYEKLLEHAQDLYELMIENGIAPEQARMVLPQSTYTEWIWSGTLYAFARVCNLRLDGHTQAETREVAERINEIIAPLFPHSWQALVAGE